jgi:hypothetical protein
LPSRGAQVRGNKMGHPNIRVSERKDRPPGRSLPSGLSVFEIGVVSQQGACNTFSYARSACSAKNMRCDYCR